MDGIGDSVALVTGAGRGIGAAVADTLTQAGATVAAADLDGTPYRLDVRDSRAVDTLVDRVEHELGPIDILVNVAGVLHPARAQDTDDERWRQTFAVNADGVFHTCRAVARRMIPRRRGSIVTVGSNAATIPRVGMAAYAASKAAARAFTQCLGLELAGHGIRCNIVSPGSTDTAMLRALQGGDPVAGDLATFRTGIPLGRVAEPRDVAEAVLFLVSARSRHITLHDLLVDGGATLRA
ncbi:SDR family oxidoreductase [Nonomuraea endophytica]|uniref:SDR family oxidoreductase n=1 Tax=Nonomuraea endophytica TaxID=714136 RepID=UPI0037CC3920